MAVSILARKWAGFYTERVCADWYQRVLAAGRCEDHSLHACSDCFPELD